LNSRHYRATSHHGFRWARFSATLNPIHLRAYLKTLPDFDEIEAEQRVIAHAQAFLDVHQALIFLVTWPDMRAASKRCSSGRGC